MIERLLQQLDFSEKEVVIYLELLRQGKTTPGRIARLTKINRSTVYAVLKELLKKGIIYEDLGQKVSYFSTKPVEELQLLYEKDQRDLERKKKITYRAIKELERYPKNVKHCVPKIRFIEEDQLEDFLYKRMGDWAESSRLVDGACWGFQDHSLVKHFQEWIAWAWKKYQLQVNLLSNRSDIENKLKGAYGKKREIMFWKENLDFTASTWVVGEYLIMLVTRQRPFYAVEINDRVLSHNMREVFRQLWKDNQK